MFVKLATTVLLFFASTGLTVAEDATTLTLTNEQVAELITAFRALDGHTVIIKEGENQHSVIEPYKFGASVRAVLGKDLVAAMRAYEPATAAVRQIILELSNGSGSLNTESKDPKERAKVTQYNIQTTKLAGEKIDVSLIPISRSDLKLEINDIPPSTLAQLDPILHD